MHLAFITMLIWENDATGLVDSHKACRMSVGFLPLFDRGTLLGRRLAKKAVINQKFGDAGQQDAQRCLWNGPSGRVEKNNT